MSEKPENTEPAKHSADSGLQEPHQQQHQPSHMRTCGCGHTRNHYAVSAEAEYTTWGWFCNLFGITARPKKLRFRCRICNALFDETDSESILNEHI